MSQYQNRESRNKTNGRAIERFMKQLDILEKSTERNTKSATDEMNHFKSKNRRSVLKEKELTQLLYNRPKCISLKGNPVNQ